MSTSLPYQPLNPFTTSLQFFLCSPPSYLLPYILERVSYSYFLYFLFYFLLTDYQTSPNVPVMFFEIVNALKVVGSSLFIILDFISMFATLDLAFYLKRHAWSLDFIVLGSSGSWCALCLLFEQCTPSVSKSVISVSQHLRNLWAFPITPHSQFSISSSNFYSSSLVLMCS